MSGIEAHFRLEHPGFVLDARFEVPGSGVTGLFGPSGSGKSTILRLIAGLERPDKGWLTVDGKVWQDDGRFTRPHRRPVGYVFQHARLFSHLDVAGNLDFAIKRAGPSETPPHRDEVVMLLGLEPLLARRVEALSGGERQRVAIARALLSRPRLMLMDEPLANLDRDNKRDILPYLELMAHRLAIPMLYVSHDLAEIERLARHLVLIEKGRVLASGPLDELMADPGLPLARDPDAAALIEAEIDSYDERDGLTTCRVGAQSLYLPGWIGDDGERVRLRVRAGDVSLTLSKAEDTSVLNILPCRIAAIEETGAGQVVMVLILEGGAARLLARLTTRSCDRLGLVPGLPVFAQVKGMALVDPDRDGGAE